MQIKPVFAPTGGVERAVLPLTSHLPMPQYPPAHHAPEVTPGMNEAVQGGTNGPTVTVNPLPGLSCTQSK